MIPQGQSSSLERLHNVEQRMVRVVELSGAVMEELGNSQGPRAEAVAAHCREFMLYMKEIQTTLREEIKSACEYRPFEKCDYSARIANEICCKKLEYVIEKMDAMQLNMEQSSNGV
ncbi:mediator of RNA polymerase II transcription subunit 11-like isoform X2 [Triticum dicoccoides]|uniref:mediator of RNA polymerase II transcription subunit 11-like isoform X2 n=1 Tax=Triticum dicoccoides TaxID=85692 RepID=UPI001891772F|nr:mediator of RNA polymerase II transcription subunit 11-like isoform X2 [Triticum dicoccoides]